MVNSYSVKSLSKSFFTRRLNGSGSMSGTHSSAPHPSVNLVDQQKNDRDISNSYLIL